MGVRARATLAVLFVALLAESAFGAIDFTKEEADEDKKPSSMTAEIMRQRIAQWTSFDPDKYVFPDFDMVKYDPPKPKWQLDLTTPVKPWNATTRPFRVLFVAEIDVYVTSMSRWFFHFYEAFRQLPSVEAYLWGPGFTGWEDDLTTAENVATRWGSPLFFDFFFNHTIHHNKDRKWKGLGEPHPPVAVWHHECVYFEKLPSSDYNSVFQCSHEAELVLHAYANHMAYFPSHSVDRLLWHFPHAAHLPLHTNNSDPASERAVDVLLIGRIWNAYPMRLRYLQLLEQKKMPGNAVQYEHPGYWINENDMLPTAVEAQAAHYVRSLETAKIILVCSTRRRYAVRKYVEAAAAGALVIGDIPGDREDEFGHYVVEVKRSDPDEVIQQTVQWWLDHPRERIARAALGQRLVRARYTTAHAARNALYIMQSYLAGVRGMVFPHPFRRINYFLPKTRQCVRS
eukprot:m51a1_g5327 hypothetical protein (456) ;mRNA; f:376054-378385